VLVEALVHSQVPNTDPATRSCSTQAVQYAVAQGVRVIAVDTGADKKTMCMEKLGCEAFIDFRECKDIPAEVKRITGSGVHAMVVTGGAKSAYEGWHELLRIGGVLVCVGLPPKGACIVGADPIFLCVGPLPFFHGLTFFGTVS
jgi:propanol-preferring alcohol dehydrogenase